MTIILSNRAMGFKFGSDFLYQCGKHYAKSTQEQKNGNHKH